MKKILANTSSRADYDLMSMLYKLLDNDNSIDLRLIVSGSHLSYTYGDSVKEIEKDGYKILLKLETLIDSNSLQSRIKTSSILLQNSIDVVAQYNPELLIIAGDREDTIIMALIGTYLRIPVMHFFGGDHTKDGHSDNPIRHATSKLSSYHMVAIQEHKNRLIKMGESTNRISCIGSPAIDKFNNHVVKTNDEILNYFGIKKGFDKFALVIYHPNDEEKDNAHIYFKNILEVLIELKINAFISFPNTDPGNKDLLKVITEYIKYEQFVFYKNLERDMFLSIYKKCLIQIGNSSSGIMESASIPIPVVNVGLRQVGRLQSGNVIFTSSNKNDIKMAIKRGVSPKFLEYVKSVKNIYGNGDSSRKAYNIIKKNNFSKYLAKKEDPLEMG